MKTLISLVLLGLSTQLHAARPELVMGKDQGVRAPFCTQQADAEAIARADSEEGIVKARAVMESKECGIGQTVVHPLRVTFSGKTDRGTTVRVVEVEVEMNDDTKQTFFMIIDVDVIGLVEA